MLNINNVNYNDTEVNLSYDLYEGTVNGKKRCCNVLYMTCLTDSFKLSIETSYDISWLNELQKNEVRDISKYIIGLPYEDSNGWLYLTDKCNCSVCKVDKSKFYLALNGNFEECGKVFKIEFSYSFEL